MNFSFGELSESLIYAIFAFVLGIGFFAVCIAFIPRWLDRMTPNIDETKEMLNGNQAVAQYYGRMAGSTILGISIIIAAAIIAGLHA